MGKRNDQQNKDEQPTRYHLRAILEVNVSTSIRLSENAQARLKCLSDKTGHPEAFFIQELATHGLEDLEDYYFGSEILERIRQGKENVYTSAQVRKELGLEL